MKELYSKILNAATCRDVDKLQEQYFYQLSGNQRSKFSSICNHRKMFLHREAKTGFINMIN